MIETKSSEPSYSTATAFSCRDIIMSITAEHESYAARIAAVRKHQRSVALMDYLLDCGFLYHRRYILYAGRTDLKRDAAERKQKRDIITRKIEEKLIIWEWKLSTGVLLGDAKRLNLLAEISFETKISDGHLRNVAFYTELVSNLADDETSLSTVLNNERIEEIRAMIYGEAA